MTVSIAAKGNTTDKNIVVIIVITILVLLFHEWLYLENTNLDGETKGQSVV